MNAAELKQLTHDVQELSGLPLENRDGIWGIESARAVLKKFFSFGLSLSQPPPPVDHQQAPGPKLTGDGTWPFTARIDGADIVCEEIVITSFGGWGGGNNADPQDNGNTASGRNTKREAIEGVSIAMDSRHFPGMEQGDPAGYRALSGAPFPKIPWGTLVEVTIGAKTFKPKDGIVDLGPGRKASKPGEPHALDLTPLAAQHFAPETPIRKLATDFSARGSFRILGGAKYVS